jgi:hypothetical protein
MGRLSLCLQSCMYPVVVLYCDPLSCWCPRMRGNDRLGTSCMARHPHRDLLIWNRTTAAGLPLSSTAMPLLSKYGRVHYEKRGILSCRASCRGHVCAPNSFRTGRTELATDPNNGERSEVSSSLKIDEQQPYGYSHTCAHAARLFGSSLSDQ